MIRGAQSTFTMGNSNHVTPIFPQKLGCGIVEESTNYPGNDLRSIPDVSGADVCCEHCSMDQNCVAWTWGAGRGEAYSDVCFLKGIHPRDTLSKVSDDGFISGQPVQSSGSIRVTTRMDGQSLYCFSLIVPWGYEKSMVEMQYRKGASIFGCDEYAVFSNRKIDLAPGLVTSAFDCEDLKAVKGGEFGTALNTPIFMKLWKEVFRLRRFRRHDWTVKVDADSVFFPSRLRYALLIHNEAPGGVYLNNCKLGMHGPLEVFSKNAIDAFQSGQQHCETHFNEVCSGDCQWGEDMFVDQCLWKVLGVKRVSNSNLLVEDHCEPPPGWETCMQPDVVAFHPFKTLDAWHDCWRGAVSQQSQPVVVGK